MTTFLEAGDVITIQKGMKVYATLPEKFIYSNRPLSEKLAKTDICVGQIHQNDIEDGEKIKHDLTQSIEEKFERKLGTAPKEAIEAFVAQHVPKLEQETFDTSCFMGEYVVISTSLSGGSSGSFNPNNDYPDGHRVVCKQLKNGAFDPNGAEISFYQSGSFTAMIETIVPIRKMSQTFIG